MSAGRNPPSNLVLRVATGAVGIPLVLGVNYLGGWVLASFLGLIAAVAAWEFSALLRAGGHRPAVILAVPASVVMAIAPFVRYDVQALWIGIIVALATICATVYVLPGMLEGGLVNWSLTVCGTIYVGLLLGHLSLLREVHRGARWIVLVLIITWAFDTGAYFVGRYFGRRPFMAHVSPKKTVEGVLGGLGLSALAALTGTQLVGLSIWECLLLGILAGGVGQIGDLVESMMKRQTGVKDSGVLIPGHGGLLDRIDSLLFTGAFTFYAAALLGYVP